MKAALTGRGAGVRTLLHVVDGVGGLDVERNRLPREGLDEDLHPAAQAQDEMQRRLLLNVVIGKGAAVLELLSGKDQSLLIRGDALLVLDLLLHIVNCVRGLDVERDRLSGQSLNENLCKRRRVEIPRASRKRAPRPRAPPLARRGPSESLGEGLPGARAPGPDRGVAARPAERASRFRLSKQSVSTAFSRAKTPGAPTLSLGFVGRKPRVSSPAWYRV